MPRVNGKSFPYTPAGKAAAKRAAPMSRVPSAAAKGMEKKNSPMKGALKGKAPRA